MAAGHQDIRGTLHENAERLREMGVRRLSVFGSAARGEMASGSDVDLLDELQPKTFDSYMDAKFFLEDMLGRAVDLVLADALKPRLRESVTAELKRVPGL
jgi:hypothetical protein